MIFVLSVLVADHLLFINYFFLNIVIYAQNSLTLIKIEYTIIYGTSTTFCGTILN